MKQHRRNSRLKRKTGHSIKWIILSIITVVVCCVAVICILFFPKSAEPQTAVLSEYQSINAICELATLKSFYHNVVMFEEKPEGGNKFVNDILFWPFGDYTKVGYKQFWMEYDGVVEAGIDASQIRISNPNSDGLVEVYIPDAQVLDVYSDESSLSEPLSESGWFTTISGQDKNNAWAAAQSEMRREAENDQALLVRAKQNAKLLLERYIVNTGKEIGVDLTVEWVDNPV